MKRMFMLLLAVLLVCFAGCSDTPEDAAVVTTAETQVAGGEIYTLVGIQLTDGGFMDQAALEQQSGGERLYVQLFEDGTAKMKIQRGEPMDMCYNETEIWRVETPDTKATYQIEDTLLTVLDYPFVYYFEKG